MARPWYAFYPADYGRDTGHLSLIEHGAYRALMDHYYATAAPLPADEPRLLRLCRANAPAEQEAVRYVLATFFDAEADGWHHARIDAEIAKAEEITVQCSIAGRASAARRQRKSNAAATDTPTGPSTEGATERQPSQSQPQSQQKYKPAAPGFAEFWAAYPRREARGPARAAYAQACRIAAPEVLAVAAAAYAARRAGQDAAFTKLPATWLAQECWLDDVAAAAETAPSAADAAAWWDGQAAPLVAEIGPAAFQAYFGQALFARGPPARIEVAAPYLRDLVARKFSHSLRRAYGEFALESAA